MNHLSSHLPIFVLNISLHSELGAFGVHTLYKFTFTYLPTYLLTMTDESTYLQRGAKIASIVRIILALFCSQCK